MKDVPEPRELWDRAKGDPEEYVRLMRDYGHIVPIPPCPTCGERTNHRHDPIRGKVMVDIFGHDKH